ncbi:hypothetical protein [Rickettsia endosymbiont of Culicoides newsteadi]|uniref:hypothetical protein n=1 Tax=Rickettsia endosymbiont of Culicoides newsteadi TaxID=1961830 RepID=UPI000B9A61D5|nr:hypothetical protein [Rickettsia endosymbiont of Culicoides newsteadi]OZG31994.1 hypothetical protein RiCNE_05870 [Rickettsia endosymbiont of Culicoides newsteadi]
MQNNTNNLLLPNHVTPATLLAAYERVANTNGIRPIPVNNNLDMPNLDTSVVNNNLNVTTSDLSTPIPNSTAPDAHPPLLGAEVQQPPTE